jgi:hypothetical protein
VVFIGELGLEPGENQEAACRLENPVFGESGSRMVAETKKGHGHNRNPLNLLVGGTGFEPVTSTV